MRKSFAAAVIALAIAVPMAPSALAASSPQAKSPKSASAKCAASVDVTAKAFKKAAKKAKKEKKVKTSFVNAGWVTTAVTPTALTFTVKGGPDKCLRGTDLTVVITDTTKIMKDDVVVPATSIAVGDHVNVKGTKAKLVQSGDLISGGSLYTATRISAEAPEAPAPVVVTP